MKRISLLIADDHTLVLEGLRKLLENEFDLLGTAEDGHALLRAAAQLRPDVILLDISMPQLNGIEACRQLVKLNPQAKVIFLTMHADAVYVEESLRAGGAGYLLKRSAASELTGAIHTVMQGRKYVTPLIDWNEPPAGKEGRRAKKRPRGSLRASVKYSSSWRRVGRTRRSQPC